jgi:hypothetical protein
MKTMYTLFIMLTTCFLSQQLLAQVVTNTNDAGAGSFRQAIADTNNGIGNGNIIFNIPQTDPGYDAGRGVFVIRIQSTLPDVKASGLVIDGNTQTLFTANTNTALLGTGGEVGVEGLTLDKVEGAEIEIVGKRNIKHGLKIDAPGISIKNIAILGFGSQSSEAYANIIFTEHANLGVIQ